MRVLSGSVEPMRRRDIHWRSRRSSGSGLALIGEELVGEPRTRRACSAGCGSGVGDTARSARFLAQLERASLSNCEA